MVLLGTLVHFVAFYLIFLNMPGDAPIAPVEGTNSSAYIRPRYAALCWVGPSGALNPQSLSALRGRLSRVERAESPTVVL